MTDRRSAPLVRELAAALTPTRWWQRPQALAVLWLLFTAATVISISLWTAPWRVGWYQQAIDYPRFAVELVAGTLGFIGLARVALLSAVPDAAGRWQLPAAVLVAWAPWLALLGYGYFDPALEPSMLGKREECYFEVMLQSLPALALGLAAARSLYLLKGVWVGAVIGLASGMFPALVMQAACMYDIQHALTHHLAPVLVPAGLGAVFGAFVARR
ncbi:MAG: NrsF family protein [Pseudomonadota bacterium]